MWPKLVANCFWCSRLYFKHSSDEIIDCFVRKKSSIQSCQSIQLSVCLSVWTSVLSRKTVIRGSLMLIRKYMYTAISWSNIRFTGCVVTSLRTYEMRKKDLNYSLQIVTDFSCNTLIMYFVVKAKCHVIIIWKTENKM